MLEILNESKMKKKEDQEFYKNEIIRLRKEKNAVILAHFYQESDVQDIADFVGDSLQLAQAAEKTKADLIVFAGVHFMAETAKIICPDKKVLLPDLGAGCSLADSCKADDFELFLKEYPNHTVISYVNTSAEIKAMTDIICTSSNAMAIVNSLPRDEKILFAPDRNLGRYIQSVTGRSMVIWNGACHVHARFSLERILGLKAEFPVSKIIAHPECENQVLLIADYIGSTAGLLKFVDLDDSSTYIVCTESGILHQMKKQNPSKVFIAAPPDDSTCACNDCSFMKMINVQKIYESLYFEKFDIQLENRILERAKKPISRMLEISNRLGFK